MGSVTGRKVGGEDLCVALRMVSERERERRSQKFSCYRAGDETDGKVLDLQSNRRDVGLP